MTGPVMRSTAITGPATHSSTSDANYPSTPAASYPSNPATSYHSTAPTPAATLAASYASAQASTPASTPASTAAATHGDYVSGEQYRYALTNFVRTFYPKYIITFPLISLLISHMDSNSDPNSLRPSHIRKSRNSGPSSKSRSGRSHGSKHA